MTEIIVDWLKNLIDNEYLLLYVLSIIPFTDMRGAILLSGGMDINHFVGYWACVGGASTIVLPMLLLFRPLMRWLKRTRLFKPLGDMLENMVGDRAESINSEKRRSNNAPYWALYIFVAIPLPLTGAWMGTAIAAFIGLKFWKSVVATSAGNLTAALILMLLVYFAQDYIDIILIVFICILVFTALVLWGRKWQKKHLEKEKPNNNDGTHVSAENAEIDQPRAEEDKSDLDGTVTEGEGGQEIVANVDKTADTQNQG